MKTPQNTNIAAKKKLQDQDHETPKRQKTAKPQNSKIFAESPDQEQLQQEGAPKQDPEEDLDTPEPAGPVPSASPSQPPIRDPSPSQEPPPLSPEPSPPPSPRPAAMSLQPEGSNCPKWPAPFFYIGEGKDRDLLRINSWFNTVCLYISSYRIQDNNIEAL